MSASPVSTRPAPAAPVSSTPVSSEPVSSELAARLRAALPAGLLVTPGDADWDEARQAWNLAVDQRPAAVALPASAAEVAAVINVAREHGLRVAAQGTGHNAGVLGALDDTILVKTTRMRGVQIDPVRRVARAEAGVLWNEVAQAAAEHGLAALAGSSPDVGVVGYTLGGGLSWLSRLYGLSSDNVEAIELVTADGRLVRADHDNEPELFWALRGGGGSFGVVTAIELRLFPITEVNAGILWWPIERAGEILRAWRDLTRGNLPDELTTLGRLLWLPPIPEIPEPVRGQAFVVVEAIHVGPVEEADRLLAPLRALAPVMDTFGTIPVRALSGLHMDPEQPVPAFGDGQMLVDLPDSAIDNLLRVTGTGATYPLISVEVRQLGGEVCRARPGNGALAALEADYIVFATGMTPVPEASAAATACVDQLKAAVAPWTARHMYLNFAETRRPADTFWSPDAYARLRRVKANVDPTDMIRGNHPIRPAHR